MENVILGVRKEKDAEKVYKEKNSINVFYKEAILEVLEKNKYIKEIYIDENLPGDIEIDNLIERIRKKNKKIKIKLIDKNKNVKEINGKKILILIKSEEKNKIINKIIKKEKYKKINIINYDVKKILIKNNKIKILNYPENKKIIMDKNSINIIYINNKYKKVLKNFIRQADIIIIKLISKNFLDIYKFIEEEKINKKIIIIREKYKLNEIDESIIKKIFLKKDNIMYRK